MIIHLPRNLAGHRIKRITFTVRKRTIHYARAWELHAWRLVGWMTWGYAFGLAIDRLGGH
jgi:hypothetical protein